MSISRQQVEAQVPKSTRRNGNDDEECPSSPPILIKEEGKKKKAAGVLAVRYRECQKNHAASMGGNARDGCGEFMPSGEEGTLEALKCSACSCHRNFHRKETEGEYFPCVSSYHHPQPHHINHNKLTTVIYPTATATLVSSRMIAPQPSSNIDDEQEGSVIIKKRFRTKFTQEQKEKMLRFAERAGWRIQKQEESVAQQLCQEIGIKRRVLKVWMHNNKHNFARTKPSTHH